MSEHGAAGSDGGSAPKRRLTPEKAKELARLSAEARKRRHARFLTLEQVSKQLPPLDSLANIRTAYELIQRWTAAGMLSGSAAGPCVRAADGALKIYETEFARERLAEAEQRIEALEVAVRTRGTGVVR